MKQTIIAAFIASVVGATSGYLSATYAVRQPTPVVKTMTAAGSAKANPYYWGELDQSEINSLQSSLKGIAKKPVIIFCGNDSYCGDIVLDFDNAFESEHWSTKIEKPMFDDTVGLSTTSRPLADAIKSATKGRLTAAVVPAGPSESEIKLTIGRKK